MGIECPECGVDKGRNFYSHLFYDHAYTKDDIERFKSRKRQDRILAKCVNSDILTCYLCGLPFARRDSLSKHLLRKHKEAVSNDVRKGLKCPLCAKEVQIHRKLVEHVNLVHSSFADEYTIEKIIFNDRKSFEEWRYDTEEKYGVKWVIVSVKSFNNRKVKHFRCSSALPTPKYLAKQSRSKKIVTCCTAFMEVIERGNVFEVKYCKRHCGHGTVVNVKMKADNVIEQVTPHSVGEDPDIVRSNKDLLQRFDEEVAALRSKLLLLSESPKQRVNEHLSALVGIMKDADRATATFCAFHLVPNGFTEGRYNRADSQQCVKEQKVKVENTSL
ncbi:C2H2-type domain-containing protein [Trichostrongylus colubriformis]|uniref:C2H2-type domain-containing protein n=1 Tax=Trichostrongylus colubriformis TaxID=6319 RepID=A0AAN8FQ04_TRICO